MRSFTVIGAIAIGLGACDAPQTDGAEPYGSTQSSIVGGVASTASQDATVLISDAGAAICTGTLLAPNLVLTARHCVTAIDERSECGGPLGANIPASRLTVSTGLNASPGSYVARGVRLFLPDSNQLCSSDIALISLDNDVQNITPAKLRFAPPTQDEVGTVVGYGDNSGARAQRTDVKVLAIGPGPSTYTTTDGDPFDFNLYVDEVTTTESTCFGDSGGPLYDSLGQIMAVASRGLDAHCHDRPTFWTTLGSFETLIKNAAVTAGHPLTAGTAPTVPTSANPAVAGTSDDSTPGTTSDKTKKKKTSAEAPAPVANSSCAQSGGSSGRTSAPVTAFAGITLLLAWRRRRSSR